MSKISAIVCLLYCVLVFRHLFRNGTHKSASAVEKQMINRLTWVSRRRTLACETFEESLIAAGVDLFFTNRAITESVCIVMTVCLIHSRNGV